MSFTAVILAGGLSSRMGTDKAFLQYQGRSLLARALETVQLAGAEEIFVSGRPGVDYSPFPAPLLLDLEPGFGPLGGIERGLQAARFREVLFVPVDLPAMTPEFLRKMHDGCAAWTGVVPKLDARPEPLVAFYPKRCHVLAIEQMRKFQWAAHGFAEACLREQAVRFMAVNRAQFRLFQNWNEPADVR